MINLLENSTPVDPDVVINVRLFDRDGVIFHQL